MNIKTYLAVIAAVLALLFGAYRFGYSRAETEGLLALEALKRANADAVIKAQDEMRGKYEKKVKELNADLNAVNDLNRRRLRELSAFRGAGGSFATCRRERNDLAELAVEGERLLGEADSYLRACTE